MTLTQNELQLLNIVKAAVSGASVSVNGIDWESIFALAAKQKLLPQVFEVFRTTPAAEENKPLFTAVKQQVVTQVLTQTLRAAEFSAVYGELLAAGLHPVVVKGRLCSRLYRPADHRISADDDILIPDSEFFACHKLLLKNGLFTEADPSLLHTADEVSYKKSGSPLYIELHRNLFDSTDGRQNRLNRFFDDFEPVFTDGCLSMPPHEHLLYLILHAFKHFVRCGVGLRQFCDIGLWARKYCELIDWELLYKQCDEACAAGFAAAVFEIARAYLGIEFDLPEFFHTQAQLEPLLHDTLCGGIYGTSSHTRLHSATVTLNAVSSGQADGRPSLLHSVFPNRAYMQRCYPYLTKRPYLLPVAWAQRILRYANELQSRSDSSASGSYKLAKERIDLMKLYGILS